MAVGSAINNNNYYPYPAWGYHSVYVVNRPYYPAAYRPPVYAGYRPAYGYHPPANYHWNQYNRNVNVNVNNNYYNRFNNTNVNTHQAYNNQNLSANNRPVQNQGNWKGQTTYQGGRPTITQGQKPGAAMANVNPRNEQYGQRANNQMAANRPNTAANTAAANRAANAGASNVATNRATTGNIGANRGSATTPNVNRPTAQPNMNRGGDRGYSTPSASTRTAIASASAARPTASSSPAARNTNSGGAFGGGGSARQERAASSRGHASMGGGGGRRSR
jgi:hypothetical protein